MGLGDWAAPTGTPLTTSVTADGFVGWNSFEDANLTPTAYGEAGGGHLRIQGLHAGLLSVHHRRDRPAHRR